jgi:tetratricopeptide (TPR) repeat protein
MTQAANLEDNTEKHPVTPSEVLPARELLGDMLMQLNKPAQALAAYEASLLKHPNRFNGLYGAGQAAEKSGDAAKAGLYYQRLVAVANSAAANRSELSVAKRFLSSYNRKST